MNNDLPDDSTIQWTKVRTPIGPLLLVGRDAELLRLEFENGRHAFGIQPGWQHSSAPFKEADRQLQEYFAGSRNKFELSLAPLGTEFQLHVWRELRKIPYGRTRSYADIARKIGRPKAVRAVGAANGKNPLSIVVPCHRVIGSGGDLTGFGGGLDTKRRLLQLEGALPQRGLLQA